MREIVIKKHSLLLWIILGLALMLRWYGYAHYPIAGETKDEFAWTWLGQSLLTGQPPTSWTWFEHYQAEMVQMGGNQYRLAKPVFDNPPLFSLIPGTMMLMRGITQLTIPPITLIRFPMIVLGVINVYLLYMATKAWFNEKMAVTAMILYAVIPTFVLSSRMVMAENLLITWLLLGLWVVKLYLKQPKPLYLLLLGIIGGLAVLTKVSGLFIPATVIGIFIYHKKWSEVMHVTLVTFIISSFWLLYAWKFGWEIFWETQKAQASLAISWSSILNLFIRPHLADKPFIDGWIYIGLIGLFTTFLIPLPKNWLPIRLATLWWSLFYIAAVGEQTWHGWYRYPLFPLMAMTLAGYIQKSKNMWVYIAIILWGILPALRLGMTYMQWNVSNLGIRAGLVVLLVLTLIGVVKPLWKPEWTYRALMVLIIATSVIVVLTLTGDMVSVDDLRFFPIRTGL